MTLSIVFAGITAFLLSFDNIYVLSDLLKGRAWLVQLVYLLGALLLSEAVQTFGVVSLSQLYSLPFVGLGLAGLMAYIGWGILSGKGGITNLLVNILRINRTSGGGGLGLIIRLAITDVLFSLDSAANTVGVLGHTDRLAVIRVVILTAIPMILSIVGINRLRAIQGMEWLNLVGGLAVFVGGGNVLWSDPATLPLPLSWGLWLRIAGLVVLSVVMIVVAIWGLLRWHKT